MADEQLLAELASDGSGADYYAEPEEIPKYVEPVADQSVAEDTEAQATEEGTEAELDPNKPVAYEDFQALQRHYETRHASDNQRIKELEQSQKAPPPGPSPQEVADYNKAKSEFDRFVSMAQSEDPDERAYGNFHAGRVRGSVISTQAVLVAREINLDPDSPEYQALLRQEGDRIEDEGDLQRIAWQAKASSNPAYAQSEAMQTEAAELEHVKETLPQMLDRLLAERGLIEKQESGGNATVRTQPAETAGSRASIRKKFERIKNDTDDWDAALKMINQHPWLTE